MAGPIQTAYSKLCIIKPGRSRLLEFEKKRYHWLFNRDFSKKIRPGCLIETVAST